MRKKISHIKISTHTVYVGDYAVRYQMVGKGEPLVLVHGLSGSHNWWIRNVPTLAQHYQLYLLDLPGFGRMRHVRGRFMLAESASWLWQWMQAVGLQHAHLVGHSMGGYICLRMAAEHPETVTRLVLVAPAVFIERHSVAAFLWPLLAGTRSTHPSFLPILFYDAWRAGPLTLLRTTRDLMVQDIRDKLHTITAPTLLVWGEHDTLVPATIAPRLRQELIDARLLILTHAGHVCMFDRARTFNTHVIDFLQGK